MNATKKYVAECIGTFVLVLIGCGTAAKIGCDPAAGSGYLTTAFAFGLAVMAMAYAIGGISGCHINPAVSLGLLLAKKMTVSEFIGYVIAQCIGAFLGALVLLPFVGKESGLGTNGLYDGSVGLSLLIEVLLTFIFVLVILEVTSKAEHASIAGLIIGLTLVVVHILGIGFTGTSVNPARSLGPALLVGGDALKHVWVFIAGPFVGAAAAACVFNFFEAK